MKIQCDSCERAEAAVLCCADEAVLCWECDQKVHGANKLASKHQRVPLLSHATQVPKCDICQEKVGHFFCLEDRALLCRQCDVSIHSTSPYVRSHQRFLLTGVKLGLTQQCLQPAVSHTATTSPSTSATTTQQSPRLATSAPGRRRTADETMATNVVNPATFYNSENPSGPGFGTHWPLDDILASTVEFDQSYFFSELGSSRDSSQ